MKPGVLLSILTAVLWGITPIFDRLGALKASPAAMMAVRFTTTFLCVLPLFFIPSTRADIAALDRRTIFYLVTAALISAIVGVYLYFKALQHMEATEVSPIVATYPVITFLLGLLFLHEKLTWTKTIGTVLAVAGVVLLSL